MASLQALPRIGDFVERYEVCGEIDSGGMSVVYAVKRAGAGGFNKLLAMKVILPNLAREERFTRMFLDEARILSLIQHSNVVQVHDVGETNKGLLFMVMELLRGRPMSRLIKEAFKIDGYMPRHIVLGVLADAAEGLHAAHDTRLAEGDPARIVHRDVSPQNIHIGFDGTVKVVDFGIAAAAGRMTETRTGELKGKLSYIAPEQIMRRTVDRRADIWSLGVIAWELLAGRRLFSGDNEVETLKNVDSMVVPPLSGVARGIPVRAADTIMRCLERDPALRPENALAVAGAFREGSIASRVQREGSVVTGRPMPPEELPDYVQRLLKTEMVIEKERLAAAVRTGPPPPVRPVSPDDETSDPFEIVSIDVSRGFLEGEVTAARPPRRWLIPTAIGGAIMAALVAWGLTGIISKSADARTETPATRRAARTEQARPPAPLPAASAGPSAVVAPEPSFELPQAPAPVERFVQVALDPRLRAVTIDGEIVVERPIRVRLLGEDVVALEATGPRGERVRRNIGPDSPDRVTLSLPREGGGGGGTAPIGPSKTRKVSPLLESPYGRKNR